MVRSGQIEPPPPQAAPGSLALADASSVGGLLFRAGLRTTHEVSHSLQISLYHAEKLCAKGLTAGSLKRFDTELLRKVAALAVERLAAYAALRQACTSALNDDAGDALLAKLKGRIR